MGVEGPIFCRQKINYLPQYDINMLRASGSTLQMIQNERQLVRINSDNVDNEKRVDIVRSDGKVLNFWIDETGGAALFAVQQNGLNQTLFLPEGATRPKLLKELKTRLVCCCAWVSSNHVLLGTSDGELISCVIESSESYFGGSLGHSTKVIYQTDQTITGCVTCVIATPRTGTNRVILAATNTQLAHFIGPKETDADLSGIVAGYTPGSNVIPFPGNVDRHSTLVLAPEIESTRRTFAWSCMSGTECFVGEIKQTADRHQTISNNKIISGHGQHSLISALSLSKFHVLSMHSNAIAATCLLNNQLVFYDAFDPKDPITGFAQNASAGTMWCHSAKSVFTYAVKNEGRAVWRIYLELGDFEEAKKHCVKERHMDEVLTCQANALLNRENKKAADYREAARLFAKANVSVTEVALKLMPPIDEPDLDVLLYQTEAIMFFLQTRLPKVTAHTERAFLVGWLVELYLSRLADLIDQHGESSQQVDEHRDTFYRFIGEPSTSKIISSMRATIYALLKQHGATGDFHRIARLINDPEAIIQNALEREDWPQAMKMLEEENQSALYYAYSSSLLSHVPSALCQGWINCGGIEAEQLLSVMASSLSKSAECQKSVLRYLDTIIDGFISLSVANLHFSLMCSVSVEKAEQYVIGAVNDGSLGCDVSYALRTLQAAGGNVESRCYLLELLKRWDESICLALKTKNQTLWRRLIAAAEADVATSPSQLKYLWLKIAESRIREDAAATAEILGASGGVITVADVLKFFPEFATIDHFKQALCSSLVAVSKQIDEHQSNLIQTQQSADQVRAEIRECQKSVRTLTTSSMCHLCFEPLLSSPFLVYHCCHEMHTKCIVTTCKGQVTKDNAYYGTLCEVEDAIVRMESFDPDQKGNETIGPALLAKTRQRVSETISRECCLCGLGAIDAIDLPLGLHDDDAEW